MPNFGVPPTKSQVLQSDGKTLHKDWANYFNTLATGLNTNYGQTHILVQQQTSDQINTLATDTSTVGAIVYNSESGEMMVNKSGTFVNISTS